MTPASLVPYKNRIALIRNARTRGMRMLINFTDNQHEMWYSMQHKINCVASLFWPKFIRMISNRLITKKPCIGEFYPPKQHLIKAALFWDYIVRIVSQAFSCQEHELGVLPKRHLIKAALFWDCFVRMVSLSFSCQEHEWDMNIAMAFNEGNDFLKFYCLPLARKRYLKIGGGSKPLILSKILAKIVEDLWLK